MNAQPASYNFSRRDLILGAGATLAALGFGAASSSANAIELAPKDKQPPVLPEVLPPAKRVGWAIVGLGELSLAQILPAFAVTRLSKPVAVVSGHPDKAKKVADHYGISPKGIYGYEDFDRIKDNPEIEVVYIVLPNSMHAEYTIRALNAKKYVLCEKPMASTVGECREMIEAARINDRKLMIAYRLRYEPFNQKMIEFARSKIYGEMRLITADNVQDVKAPNIRLSKSLGGGPLGDVGVYCLNASRYLTGEEPVEVNAMLNRNSADPRFAEVPDRIIFQLRFPSGVLANCSAGFSAFESRRYQVMCQDGWFGLDPAFSYSGLRAEVGVKTGREMLRIEAANHFAAEMDHFSACVLNNAAPTTPGEDGMRDVAIMEKILEAAEAGHAVKIEP